MIAHHHKSSAIRPPANAFALRELIVALAIVGALATVGYYIYKGSRLKAHQQVAMEKIRQLGGAVATYAEQNGGALPAEDAEGNDTLSNAAKDTAKNVWYNALPRLIGKKGLGDYSTLETFYKDDNILYLPGANYPDVKKFNEPMFAIAFNTKLQRTNPDNTKPKTLMKDITQPERTVVLLEQGLKNEKRTLDVQTKSDYDGSPRGSAKSFVGRYDGKGHLYFLDGHAELVDVQNVLTPDGKFPFPQEKFVWTRTPEENPNKEGKQDKKK